MAQLLRQYWFMDLRQEPRHVLVVDDQPDERIIFSSVLQYFGFRVTEASNGVEALEAVQRDQPHLILMDLRMPLLDGASASLVLKSHPLTSHIPIICCTGYDPESASVDMVACDRFLQKPVLPRDLMVEVYSVLEERGDRPPELRAE
jgi:CheY-like chemotaxis protein